MLGASTGGLSSGDASNVSLSVNYLPTKFSSGMLNAELEGKSGTRRRRGKGAIRDVDVMLKVPKMGGGLDAFKAGEARMGGEDEDADLYDTSRSTSSSFGKVMFWKKDKKRRQGSSPPKEMRWNRFKWILFISNTVLTIYSFACLIVCLLLWFGAWQHADVVRVGNRTELIISTLASCMGLFTCLLGWAGILMNNRVFLAIYSFLLWITFIFLVIPGYLTYKRRTFNLEGKINAQWSRDLGPVGRITIQNSLSCCGYFSPYVEATVSQTCYSRSVLPGCKKAYIDFERDVLQKWYTVVFAIVPVHLVIMTAALLCSNHVTYRFGKGMMPKRYRLSLSSMALIMENYAQQLVERYGTDVASDIMSQSKSQVKLGSQLPQDMAPTLPYLALGNVGSLSSAGTSLLNNSSK
ncbi:tetraspanin Tsp2 [Coprinopsis cinerea okayama7|uniref:Tetraspanin Tsp2 n=1 Tax=Coprinopsis cinerea (strain Okayama-7 / 130 / ATCC MYA-4618 / FGSC 9003) TaxID=240176 RepID=A8NSF0_COPC7|nr:tetraspanin Tsp2 [Coprinopsis cinerea okayama7\|eukprot:XP_001835997.1 tetraspanin Tsp2 [Coprinopsis cinerea okayama7\